jgi:hypothetical protein
VSREKKMKTKENIERDQRKVQYAKHKNYCHTYSYACTRHLPCDVQRKQESTDISSYDFFQASSAVSLKTLHNRDRTLCEWHTASMCWKPEP